MNAVANAAEVKEAALMCMTTPSAETPLSRESA